MAKNFDYLKWVNEGDNLTRVLNYFDNIVGVSAKVVAQDGLTYNTVTKKLSFNEFILDGSGRKTLKGHNIGTKRTRVTVSEPPPWVEA